MNIYNPSLKVQVGKRYVDVNHNIVNIDSLSRSKQWFKSLGNSSYREDGTSFHGQLHNLVTEIKD